MTVTPRTLRAALARLNKHREQKGEKPLSHAQIGKATDLAKSTVSAILIGTYTSKTRDAHAARILDHLALLSTAAGLSTRLPQLKTQNSELRTQSAPRPLKTVYCTAEGYLTHNHRTYYAGRQFAGLRVTVAAIRGRDHAVRITNQLATREAHPVDPANNQLGYTPQEAA